LENNKAEVKLPASGKKIVLAGNPNVGKSVFFNALTGLYVDVSNYPGTTLDMACGRYNGDVVFDTPGVYGVSSFSEEEGITRDIVLAADLVVNVVDAVHLERDLFLTLQIIDMGIPTVVALNMVDEAARVGLKINTVFLEKLLGVPVVSTAVVHNTGIEELKKKIYHARPGHTEAQLLRKIENMGIPAGRAEALLILEGDPVVSERNGVKPGMEREQIYRARTDRASQIVRQVVKETGGGTDFASGLGRLMLRPSTGFPLLLLALWVIYELVGVFLAQVVVPVTEDFMIGYYEPAIDSLLGNVLPRDSVILSILTGRFGLLTFTVTNMIGLLLPLVLGIFLVLSVLEDSGYLPRIATLIDRALSFMGLNGQAIIPIILGFGCVTMAIITTRMLKTDRERRIAIFLLALGVPCSAQMAIVMAVLAVQGGVYLLFYLCFMFCVLVSAGTLLGRFLPGEASPLLIELPPLRLPGFKNVWKKALLKSSQFMKEAFPLFAAGALLLGILDVTGMLQGLREFFVPITVSWLHLPVETADVFIMGLIRKEFGAANILVLKMLPLQNLVILITLTLTVPCIASTMIILKERGWREGLLIWFAVLATAFLIGGLVTRLLEFFSVSGHLQNPILFGVMILALVATVLLARFSPPGKTL
jgi:ferrous iron transport protein B